MVEVSFLTTLCHHERAQLPYMLLSMRTVTHESAEPQKTAADQVDCGQTHSQAKTFFDLPGD